MSKVICPECVENNGKKGSEKKNVITFVKILK